MHPFSRARTVANEIVLVLNLQSSADRRDMHAHAHGIADVGDVLDLALGHELEPLGA